MSSEVRGKRIQIQNLAEVLSKFSAIDTKNSGMKRRVASILETSMDYPTKLAKVRALQKMSNKRGTASKIAANLKSRGLTGKRKGIVAVATTGMKDITSAKGQTISIQSVEWGQNSNRFTKRFKNTGRIGSNKHDYRTGWYSKAVMEQVPSIQNHATKAINQLIQTMISGGVIK